MHATLYDHLGEAYDSTRMADPRITERIYSLLRPIANGSFLDLACGTGNYTMALRDLGLTICGIDQSELMIANATKKAQAIEWHVGNAEALPFPANSFDGVVCTLATHHFRNIGRAFTEVFRVISIGRFVIYTAYPQQMRGYWTNEYFPRVMERAMSEMPSKRALFETLNAVGFQQVREEIFEIPRDVKDLFLYSGKCRPEIYLLPQVRAGISSFANSDCEDEVREGCRRLEQDLQSGRISEVMARYADLAPAGDYVFVIAEKF